MTMTQRLLEETRDIWDSYHVHPFVKGIADGSLDVEKFRFYMIQDYLYLIDYAKVFALGIAKARDIATMRIFAAYVQQILSGEMDIHKGYMKRLGISGSEAQTAAVSLDNSSYTAYMLRVAYDEGPAEIAAAILSCALSYEVIARKIVEENPKAAEHEFYGEWINGYACEEYSASNRVLTELVDTLTAEYTEAQRRRLCDVFIACSKYEGAFWDMAWEMKK